ncbi:Spo12 family protein [Talaromyces islandicus]|uniref:Spo12 family protein n=1 Tax=Talaromyces islandicus TaxID=28573 RepID=A0A0U1LWQ8_TALIS|nr:Spo12 family protein [Talaromyces islandicus]
MNSATVQPLGDRSTNAKVHAAPENNDELKQGTAVQSMEYHRKALQEKLKDSDQSQASYVSPSDDIMSPCTKKLSDLKTKRFKSAGKPTSLFTKLGKKNFEQSSSAVASASPENAN